MHERHRYRPGAAVGRSHGSPHPGHSGPRLAGASSTVLGYRGASAPTETDDAEAVGPVAMGQQLPAVLALEIAAPGLEKSLHDAFALGPRDRANRVDERPARTHERGPGLQQLELFGG